MMKKLFNIKNFYIVAIACVIVGAVLFTIGFGMKGFSFDNISSEPDYFATIDTFKCSKDTSIVVDDDNTSIKVIASNRDDIQITYFQNENNEYTIEQNNNEIKIDKQYKSNIVNFSFTSFEDTSLVIEVPAEAIDKIDISTSNAKIYIDGVSANEVIADTSNAKIEIINVISSDSIDAKTSNGGIDIGKSDAKEITLKTSNAKVELYNIEYTEKLEVKTSNGAINGNVNVKASDCAIECDTSNGDCRVPSGNGNITTKFDTSNGSVNVDFK